MLRIGRGFHPHLLVHKLGLRKVQCLASGHKDAELGPRPSSLWAQTAWRRQVPGRVLPPHPEGLLFCGRTPGLQGEGDHPDRRLNGQA